jgi:hypothetical protein
MKNSASAAPISRYAYLLCAALIVATACLYYPKWQQRDTEATISWDVSGYYLYLPAALIYGDMTRLAFFPEIEKKYHPGPGMGQAFRHEKSGNYVMKYSSGQAWQFLPWFAAAHLLAEPLGYPADGFSRPYQAAIGLGSLVVALLGLWFARRNLLCCFSDRATAVALLLMVWGSNYLNYSAIDGAMTHNWLFTAYSLLIFSTIQFYRKPSMGWAAAVGLFAGWAVLTRPTELVALLLPLLWGVGSLAGLRERLLFFVKNYGKTLVAGGIFGVIVFSQMAYWHWATGEWLVYSYQDQGFSWLRPHLSDVLFSCRAGWLTYSPVMALAVVGLWQLWRQQRSVFWAVSAFCAAFLYVTSAWDIWWYGGSLGSRAMVQSHAAWLFPLAAFSQHILEKKWARVALPLASGLLIWFNLWWTHQAHRGGLFQTEQMTQRYFWKVLGRSELNRDWLKLLDTKEEFRGAQRNNVREIFVKNFEADSVCVSADAPISGAKSLLLNKDRQFSPLYELPIQPGQAAWLRASVTFRCDPKEWDYWRMAQFIVKFQDGERTVKERMIRLQRHVDGSEVRTVFFDTRLPDQPFTRAAVLLWNSDSDKVLRADDLRVEAFE